MKIIIIGAGTVGAAICVQLAGEGHEITVVDRNSRSIAELSDTCDVVGIEGNGADVELLRRAGAEKADLLIAVTSSDEANILCCAAAHKLGTEHTIARVRNPEYAGLMQLMKNEMNLSLTINPELAAAKDIYRMLRFPSAAKIDTFCHGRVELAEFVVSSDSALCGTTLNNLRSKLNIKFLVCCVRRGGQVYIPKGDFSVEAGDVVCVTAPEKELSRFFKAAGVYKDPVKDVLIVGGGRTTYYLEQMLETGRISSTVIEQDKALCGELAGDFGCTVIRGDGTKQEVLLENGIERTGAFIALSDVDEENAIVSMYAKSKNVQKVITMISTISYIDFFKSAGLESIVSPKSVTAAQILRFVRSKANTRASDIESLHKMMDGKVEAIEFLVNEKVDDVTDIPLKQLRPRAGVLIACIVRRGNVILPSGDDTISKGDTVIVITLDNGMKNIREIVKK